MNHRNEKILRKQRINSFFILKTIDNNSHKWYT